MSCLTQHKTKEELHAWLMNSAEDIRDDKSFVDMLAGDIWDMMNAESPYQKKLEEENKKLKAELEVVEAGTFAAAAKLLDTMRKENKKLKEENEELKEEAEQNQQLFDTTFGELMKLKEENKKQKKEHIQNIMKTKRIATELYREMKYALGYGEFDEPDRKVMYEEIKKLKEESKVDKEFQEEVMQENKKLKQKATAWDIINSVEWQYVRDLCDKEMCKDLIACGECEEEDFEGYEGYEEEESDEEEVVQDINGKNLKIPTEEELKVLGVSREDFIMLAKKSDCAY